MNNDLLKRVAAKIKTGYELMGSKWRNSEAEVIATQAISSCAFNLEKIGEAMSYQGVNTRRSGGMGLVDNGKGLDMLIGDGSIVVEPYEGQHKPDDPAEIMTDEQGRFMVLRVTDALLEYVAVRHLSMKLKVPA